MPFKPSVRFADRRIARTLRSKLRHKHDDLPAKRPLAIRIEANQPNSATSFSPSHKKASRPKRLAFPYRRRIVAILPGRHAQGAKRQGAGARLPSHGLLRHLLRRAPMRLRASQPSQPAQPLELYNPRASHLRRRLPYLRKAPRAISHRDVFPMRSLAHRQSSPAPQQRSCAFERHPSWFAMPFI